jgi:phosphonoacetaldehyde hydrolase
VLQAVVLDWAGTVVDHGSSAPAIAFREAFQELGVPLGDAEARGPMGLAKRDHVQHVLAQPNVAAKWRARFGEDPDAFAVDTVMAVFEPLSTSTAATRADLIPGALAAVADCRRRGLQIGSTTGYTRPVMDQLVALAARQGYIPDLVVCAGDVPEGRPSPLMMWHTMVTLGVWPAETVVKVDDTAPGIWEGRNAGTWTIGIALTGNIAGLTIEELATLAPVEIAAIRARAEGELSGAHVVIDSIAQLPAALDGIERRLRAGESPE